ncbi:MAG: o-succinylbenzoate synthase [Kineosporiaceae bacterium]
MTPDVEDLLAQAHVVVLPLHTAFRGLTRREALLLRGPHGWGEFAPFVEYGDAEASRWLEAAIEAAWRPPVPVRRRVVPVNATVPAVPAHRVAEVLARFPGCTTAKVKVAERGQDLADDVARVAEVRTVLGRSGRIRVDANGAWDVGTARRALGVLSRFGLEYAEQPCSDLTGLRSLRLALARDGVDLAIAADESVRKAGDPLRVAVAGAADIVVIKVAPLGGVRAALDVAQALGADHGLAVVVSSALDTSVGLAAGIRLAAALPDLPYACGLGTASLLAADVTADPLLPEAGAVAVRAVVPDPERLTRLAAAPERARWWLDRVRRCAAIAKVTPGDV